MFSTFTGNSRRPRNVNLSGAAGNPFANTSWTPSTVSGTTKTISDAQADREKRQAERQRLKAASRIQRTWRGHETRSHLADQRRAVFDELYCAAPSAGDTDRLHQAFDILLSFCRPARPDDLRRLLQYANDAANVDLHNLWPPQTHSSRLRRLFEIIVSALHFSSTKGYDCIDFRSCLPSNLLPSPLTDELRVPFHLATRIIQSVPQALSSSSDEYFSTLARICRQVESEDWLQDLIESLSVTLQADSQGTWPITHYEAYPTITALTVFQLSLHVSCFSFPYQGKDCPFRKQPTPHSPRHRY